ncbi:hypothetical protein GWK48_01455 [Metallosphaera tengchongensis]|uniref:DUF2721 domain-containing protein n=1 Tax=Metallosphaera tengchongensis TaxID=1532350 RepID=A0A6N0NTU1_9CREN|nr:hypothetical protein [Metallosphaera tengchongensis]QKQ99238.1 hypothetical protein GWK48_01455 [Metallosphaera tengchongensis]
MAYTFQQVGQLFSVIILIELVIVYYGLERLIGRLKLNSGKIEDLLLLHVFKKIVGFVSENDVVQQSLLGAISGLSDRELLNYLRDKVGEMKGQLTDINDSIQKYESVKRFISRILSLSVQVRVMAVISLVGISLTFFLTRELLLVVLGVTYGIELVALYYSFFSIFLYYKILRNYSDVLKSIESL